MRINDVVDQEGFDVLLPAQFYEERRSANDSPETRLTRHVLFEGLERLAFCAFHAHRSSAIDKELRELRAWVLSDGVTFSFGWCCEELALDAASMRAAVLRLASNPTRMRTVIRYRSSMSTRAMQLKR